MSVLRRDFLLLATLAGAAAAPCWAQTAPEVRAEDALVLADGAPDDAARHFHPRERA